VNDNRPIKFNGQGVWLRVLVNGKAITFPQHKTRAKQPTNQRKGYNILSTEDPKILTFKWTKPGEKADTVINWKEGTPLPAGWSMEEFFRVKDGDSLEITP
jgi:hypothetical protein